MSNRAVAWAFEQRLANPFQQMVLHAIADWADPMGQARQCDLHYLADCARLTTTKVRKHLSEMRNAGIIDTAEKFTEEGQRVYDIGLHLDKSISVKREAVSLEVKPDPNAERPASRFYAPESAEAKALTMLHVIACRGEAFRKIFRRSDGSVNFVKAMTPQLLALAQAPEQSEWVTIDHRQAGSWEDLLKAVFEPEIQRKRFHAGDRAPWAWAPSVEGKIYTSTDPPAQPAMTTDDLDALASEGQR